LTVLRDVVTSVIIIAHNEDTGDLEHFFARNGHAAERQVMAYTPEQLQISSILRCFLNHRLAWQKAESRQGYTLICEADFVPVQNLFDAEVFWPTDDPLAFGYLYQCSPRVLAFKHRFIRVHCAGLVGYVVNKSVALLLLDFFEDQKRQFGLKEYYTFDAHLQWYCMGRGASAYMSYRQLGEHGGLASQDHKINDIPRGGHHRADTLAGALAFRPLYAKGKRIALVRERLFGWGIGMARLFALRWTMDTDGKVWSFADRAKAHFWAARRLLSSSY
jgi:hypothetical protein